MVEYKEMNTHGSTFRVEIFGNSVEYAKAIETRTWKRGWHDDHIKTKDSWALGDTMKSGEEALDKFKNGYNDTVKDIQMAVNNAIKTIPQEKTVSMSSGVVGFAPIVPNAILGLPNSMITVKRKTIKSKVIDILYSTSVAAYVGAGEITKAGIKLLETIVKLEKKGYRVRLNILASYYENHDADVGIVCIKSENEPMTLSRLTFPLTTPAMFRVLSFAWYERSPQTKYKSGYGCGWGYKFSEDDRKEIARKMLNRPNSNTVYIECKDILEKGEKYLDKCFEGIIR